LLTVATLSLKKLWQNQLIVDTWIMWLLYFSMRACHIVTSKTQKSLGVFHLFCLSNIGCESFRYFNLYKWVVLNCR